MHGPAASEGGSLGPAHPALHWDASAAPLTFDRSLPGLCLSCAIRVKFGLKVRGHLGMTLCGSVLPLLSLVT